MPIDPSIWSKLHGAGVHFPIALMLVSALCDTVSLVCRDDELQRGFRFAATVTIILGALGSYAAVISGLVMAKWQFWGHSALLRHHQFVWPAFGLMVSLATWRIAVCRRLARRRPTAVYLTFMILAVVLIGGAGYTGGELLNHG
jgi:uncharacterized membrane protein